jgi:hypothetical protein
VIGPRTAEDNVTNAPHASTWIAAHEFLPATYSTDNSGRYTPMRADESGFNSFRLYYCRVPEHPGSIEHCNDLFRYLMTWHLR